ncbi:MAG TPA: alkaline phosphatase family protein, partial [Ignavibacteriaceae bacterium]|nr:alkaline phosphatase family protein [Ignavibacteriaceae bacterium]
MKNFFLTVIIYLVLFSYSYSQNQPYTILISFDGFRWDYQNRNITPNIDKIKEEGISSFSLKPVFP